TLARQYGADRLWIVNVGHLKGYEFPLGYFLDLAWDPDRWSNDNLRDYTRLWAQREFGAAEAPEIADLIVRSTRYNGRCKPELLSPGTYSLVNYREAETVVDDFERVVARAEAIGRRDREPAIPRRREEPAVRPPGAGERCGHGRRDTPAFPGRPRVEGLLQPHDRR